MITIYHYPRCSKSRAVLDYLTVHAPDEELLIIDYINDPPSATELKELLERGQLSPRDAIRTSEQAWRALALDEQVSDDDLIEIMVSNPILIQRPIVSTEKGVVIARPTQKIMEVL